jgi:hypothetical protein
MSKISFNKERDFSALFSDSIAFLKQNFKSFFGAILLIAGPFLLLSGASLGYLQSLAGAGRNSLLYGGGGLDYTTLLTAIGILFFSAFVGSMVLYCVVYNYMILYNNKPEGEPITVSEVGKQVLTTIWRTMGSLLVLTLVAGLAFAIIGLAAVGIGSALGLAGTVIIGFAFVVALIIYGPVIGYVFQAMFFVVIRDDIFGMAAFGKVWNYMKGNFWWTWVVMVVGSFALYIVNLLFTLPATIYSLMGTFSRLDHTDYSGGSSGSTVTLVVLYTIGMFFSHFTSSVLLVISAFNFLSHEEVQEGKGLFSRIDEIK